MILRAKTCHGSAEGRGLIEHKRALEPAKVSLLESGVLMSSTLPPAMVVEPHWGVGDMVPLPPLPALR
jgi:hypothetical protein